MRVPAALLEHVDLDVRRAIRRAANGLRHLSEIDRPATGVTPRELVWERDKVQLWRYASNERRVRTPVLLVMSLVTRPYVFDLRPGSSFVERLLERGFDVFLIDWGVPDAVESGNTLETYCDGYLPDAAGAMSAHTGCDDVTVIGYCLGGLLSLLFSAWHEQHVRNLVLVATPVDFTTFGPIARVAQYGHVHPDDLLDETGNVPADVVRDGIRLLKPTADVLGTANLWLHLDDRQFLDAYASLTAWSLDHIPFPGAAFRQIVEVFLRRNCLLDGRVPLGERTIDVSGLRVPVLSVSGTRDYLVPPESSDPLEVVIRQPIDALRFPTGHVGLFVGNGAERMHIPAIASWVAEHSDY
jgi:polyhydroxyalkanoate synthase